jgi:hypothetical protein
VLAADERAVEARYARIGCARSPRKLALALTIEDSWMATRSSFGVCEVCGTRSGKAAMAARLRKCLPRAGATAVSEGLLIRAQATGAPMFRLDCAVKMDAKLNDLDRLFRCA